MNKKDVKILSKKTSYAGFMGLEGYSLRRVFALSYEEAFAAMQQGKINNALAIIALQWLCLNQAGFAGKLTTK